mgnify:CR=1 FL=1
MDKVCDFVKVDIELISGFVVSGNVKVFVVVWVNGLEFHADSNNMGDFVILEEGKIAGIGVGTKEKVFRDFGHCG